MAAERPRFTILICVKERAARLRECLRSLRGLEGESTVQLLVVCDGGPALLRADLETDFQIKGWRCDWIQRAECGGPAKARNEALPRAEGELILFLNDDVRVEPGLLTAHDCLHRKRPGHAVMGNTRWAPEVVTSEFMHWVAHHDSFYYLIPDELSATWEYFHTMNLSIDRMWFDDGARFDEAFPDPAFEDTEFGYRLWQQGLKIGLAYDAILYHVHEFTFDDYLSKSVMRGRSARRFCELYPELRERIISEYKLHEARLKGWRGFAARFGIGATPMELQEARIAAAFLGGYRAGGR